ncbi:MAG TPA: alanine racemase [Candidatus Alectryocaccobium stercorigallinarum]|nr:alanine racemase [Candidatus Alectryocaccobium stercorigallinarum]
MQDYFRCYAVVSLSAIVDNLKNVRGKLPEGTSLMAVLKADAYGHGADVVGKHIEKYIDAAGVASVEEGIGLRKAGLSVPVLVLGYSSPRQFGELLEYSITPTIFEYDDAVKYSEESVKRGVTGKMNIAVDTGMTRVGFRVNEGSADLVKKISKLPNITIEGMFTHLSCADTYDDSYSEKQFAEFEKMVSLLEERKVDIPVKHMCNSAGIMKYDSRYYNCVRCGIATYGLYPSEEVDKNLLKLTPALEWKAHVIHISEVEAGRGVSYGATYVTHRDVTRIATLSVGYADGYPRALSSKGVVLINGKRVPVIGRVCMDQIMVDITEAGEVNIEDTATLIGHDGDEFISVEEVAEAAGSFNYELVCQIGKRVKRIYI